MRLVLRFMVLYDIGDCFSIGLALRIGLEGAEYPLVIPVWGGHQQNKLLSDVGLEERSSGPMCGSFLYKYLWTCETVN